MLFIVIDAVIVSVALASIAFPLPHELMTDDEAYLQLVNRDHLFDDATFKKDLVPLKVRTKNDTELRLRRVASRALTDLFAAAEAEGVRLYAISAYRDLATQRALYNNDVKANNGIDDHSTQIPGASEHQTGLAVDLVGREWLGYTLTEAFADTVEARWLASRCAEFGFVIRYPKTKESITGIVYEPWHLRYVGLEAAQYMTDNELTLEELWMLWYLYLEDNVL
ncbi:MAG: M15 family metallopeptidase [Oscillospiraceae bacterium]|nr:M15 family metallopeptidase [Oscillospiraceae bacterium]